MTHHEHPKIIAFVGLAGSGKSTAISHFTQKGYPKVTLTTGTNEDQDTDTGIQAAASQIQHLFDAGQRHLVVDGLTSWAEYSQLKAAFPGEINLIAIVAPRLTRYHRLSKRESNPLTTPEAHARDAFDIEHLESAGPIAIADHYVINDASLEAFTERLDAVFKSLDL